MDKTKILKYIYTIILIIISFLIFSEDNLTNIMISLKNMFLINKINFYDKETLYFLKSYIVLIVISILLATPLLKTLKTKIVKSKFNKIFNFIEPLGYILLLIISTAFLIDASFNPFLYFRF